MDTSFLFLVILYNSSIYSGLVPQHPPITLTPRSINPHKVSANSSLVTSYFVSLPIDSVGSPALG